MKIRNTSSSRNVKCSRMGTPKIRSTPTVPGMGLSLGLALGCGGSGMRVLFNSPEPSGRDANSCSFPWVLIRFPGYLMPVFEETIQLAFDSWPQQPRAQPAERQLILD